MRKNKKTPLKRKDKKQEIKRSKNIIFLVFCFLIALSVSLVLILFENINQKEEDSISREAFSKQRVVAGDYAESSGFALTNYRQYLIISVEVLDSIIWRVINGEKVEIWEAEAVYGALLSMQVPSIYQSLHISLLSIARGLQEKDDLGLVIKNYDFIAKKYPWLVSSINVEIHKQ